MAIDYKFCQHCQREFDMTESVGANCPYCDSILELCEDEFEVGNDEDVILFEPEDLDIFEEEEAEFKAKDEEEEEADTHTVADGLLA